MSVLDLRKTYLQVQIDKTLRPFQTVVFHGKRYCLTKLGFSLNVTLQIMKNIVSTVLSQEEMVEKSTLAYLNDIYINEDVSIAYLSEIGTVWPGL